MLCSYNNNNNNNKNKLLQSPHFLLIIFLRLLYDPCSIARFYVQIIHILVQKISYGYNYDSTSIRRPFDGHSTAYQRLLRSQ